MTYFYQINILKYKHVKLLQLYNFGQHRFVSNITCNVNVQNQLHSSAFALQVCSMDIFLNHSNLTWLIKLFDKWYQLGGWTTTNLFMIWALAGEYSLLIMSYKSWLWYVHTIIKWTPYYFTAQKYIPIIMVMFYKLTTPFFSD